MTDLRRTKEYLERAQNARMNVRAFLILLGVVLIICAATFSILTFLGPVHKGYVILGVGFGFGAVSIIIWCNQYITALCGEPVNVRPDLQTIGVELYHLSKQVILDRRIEDELGTRLERAADITLTALDRLPTLAATQPKLAHEIELGLHEAMHEVIAIVRPFVRPKGVGKTRHAKQIGHLNPTQALESIGILIVKLEAVNQTLAGTETRELRLDQTLAHLMELKQAEAELDQSIRN